MRHELIRELEEATSQGVFPANTPATVALRILTMGVLGVAVMRLSGRLTAEYADCLVTDVLNVTLAGLETGVVLSSDSAVSAAADEVAAHQERNRDHAQMRG
jgi:hypothetical protein